MRTQKRPECCPDCGTWLSDGRFYVVDLDGKIVCPTRLAVEDEFKARLDDVQRIKKDGE